MNLLFHNQGLVFRGKVKDIIHIFDEYPHSITLLDFIRLHLN